MLLGAEVEVGRGEINGCLGPAHDMIGGQVGIQFQIGGKCDHWWNQEACVCHK